MVLCTLVISIIVWEWNIHYASLSTSYIAKLIKNCTKSTSVTNAATMKNMNGAAHPSYRCHTHQFSKYRLRFFVNYYQLITQQYESRPSWKASQGSYYEKYGQFPLRMQRKPSHATAKLILFAVSKDEWNINEDTG